MARTSVFNLKEDDSQNITIKGEEIKEIVPDADFRFSLVILKNGEKHFICGTEAEIRQTLDITEG